MTTPGHPERGKTLRRALFQRLAMIVVAFGAASIWRARFPRSGRADLRRWMGVGELGGHVEPVKPRCRGCRWAIGRGGVALRRSICRGICLASPLAPALVGFGQLEKTSHDLYVFQP